MPMQSDWAFEVEPARPAQEGTPAAGPIYRSTGAREGPPALEGASTCYELFHRSVELYADRPCLGARKVVDGQAQGFTYITYAEAGIQVRNIGSAMQAVGVKAHDRAGVFGANSPEWMIALQVLRCQTFIMLVGYFIQTHNRDCLVHTPKHRKPCEQRFSSNLQPLEWTDWIELMPC